MLPLLGLECSLPETPARLAGPPPSSGRRDVVGCEGVATLAVGLACVLCARAAPAQNVLGNCRDLHVRRVDASWVVAEVVDGETVRDSPDQHLIGVSMGRPQAVLPRGPETPVASKFRSGPLPTAAGLVDSCPEALLLGGDGQLRRHGPSKAARHLVVQHAQPATTGLPVAFRHRANIGHDNRSTLASVTCQAGGCA